MLPSDNLPGCITWDVFSAHFRLKARSTVRSFSNNSIFCIASLLRSQMKHSHQASQLHIYNWNKAFQLYHKSAVFSANFWSRLKMEVFSKNDRNGFKITFHCLNQVLWTLVSKFDGHIIVTKKDKILCSYNSKKTGTFFSSLMLLASKYNFSLST